MDRYLKSQWMRIFKYLYTLKSEIMAGTVNKVILVGHTGDEVKMKYFEGGNCMGRFPLAASRNYVK
jgi:hypothetical protein